MSVGEFRPEGAHLELRWLLVPERYLALQFVNEVLEEDDVARVRLHGGENGGDTFGIGRNVVLASYTAAQIQSQAMFGPHSGLSARKASP
jgi:hypothetical protein